jgi:hypothetical protein
MSIKLIHIFVPPHLALPTVSSKILFNLTNANGSEAKTNQPILG